MKSYPQVFLIGALLCVGCSESPGDLSANGSSTSQQKQTFKDSSSKPYVLVSLRAGGNDPDVSAGMRDLIKAELPNVIAGMSALCPEFTFGTDQSSLKAGEYLVFFIPEDVDQFKVGVARVPVKRDVLQTLLAKSYPDPDDAYAAACGALRRDLRKVKGIRKDTNHKGKQ